MHALQDDTSFFGHPRGLAYLAFTQVWERFSFYGMQALLGLYMVHQLLLPGHVENVIGIADFRAGLEAVVGPLTRIALSAQIFGLYVGLVSLTPLIGAWLGDSVLGQRRTVMAGLMLMALGHLLMSMEAAFLFARLCLVLGAGCLKGNMYAQVGELYRPGDARCSGAFSMFLIALNVGAFFAPLVCGTLGELYGYHYGFGVAAIGLFIGLGIYIAWRKYLPPDRRRPRKASGDTPHAAIGRDGWRSIAAIMLLVVATIPINVASFQAYNVLILWASDHVDRAMFGMTFPVTWLLTFDGLMTIVGVALAVPAWRWLAARRREPDSYNKMVISGSMVASAYGLLALGAGIARTALVPIIVVFAFFALLDLSYGWYDPPANAFVSRFSPASVTTTMMSLMLMSVGVANVFLGWLGRFYEPLGPAKFWALHAGIAALGVVLSLVFRPIARHLLADHPAGIGAPGATTAF
jgi:POT family proton-dependent oligopeptide transporter